MALALALTLAMAAVPARAVNAPPLPPQVAELAPNLKAQGGGYIKQFTGPIWWLTPLMLPIEIVSHAARPVSLTIRLFANMFAGEQVTLVFLSLTYIVVPVAFMGLHVFISVIQAYVFALLTLIYVGAAMSEEH